MARVPVLCGVLVVALSLLLTGCQQSTASFPVAVTLAGGGESVEESGAVTTVTPATDGTQTTTPESPVEVVLQRMSLRQKAAQVLLLQFNGLTILLPEVNAFLTETPPGGLILFRKNVRDVEQLTALNTKLQDAAGQGLEGVKLFIAVDQEGGEVQRVREGVPNVPAARDVGQNWTPEEAAAAAGSTAKGLLAQGVNMNLSPVADVVEDPGFLYTRSFSGAPDRVAAFVSAITEAYEREGLITVMKHFPGHGSVAGDSHIEALVSTATLQQFESVHLVPFEAGIEAGAEGVIVGHIVAKAYDAEHPASSSPRVIGQLLRGQLGFKGLVVSDSVEMTGARMASGPLGSTTAQQAADAAVACLKAGCDLLLSTGPLDHEVVIVKAIAAAVQSGEVPLARLDDAVRHVLELKASHRLLRP